MSCANVDGTHIVWGRDSEDQEVGAYTYDAYGNVLTVEGDLAKENPGER